MSCLVQLFIDFFPILSALYAHGALFPCSFWLAIVIPILLCAFLSVAPWPLITTASNAMWDEVVRLNTEFGIENIGSPRPHTPPSSNALEVDPVSWARFFVSSTRPSLISEYWSERDLRGWLRPCLLVGFLTQTAKVWRLSCLNIASHKSVN